MIKRVSNEKRARLFWGMMITIILLSGLLINFAGTILSYASQPYNVTVTRTLPLSVIPGQMFNVTVTFISPANNFNAVGLSDFVPPGWTVSVNNSWNIPNSDANIITVNRADYIWNGPFTMWYCFYGGLPGHGSL